MRLAGLFVLSGLLCLSAQTTLAQPNGGPLVLVGGSLESPKIFDTVVKLAGGPGRAKIGVITAASGNSAENSEYYKEIFRRHGVADVQWIPLGRDARNLSRRELLGKINNMTGFFFGGGDQSRLLKTLTHRDGSDSVFLAAIRKANRERGALIGGTSAGTAVQVKGAMITGGESYDALARRPNNSLSPRSGRQLSFHSKGGFGLFSFGALDTHFNERGRAGRLIRLADATRQKLAFGVDEDTALVVNNPLSAKPKMTVVGSGGVSIFDLTRARSRTERGDWSIKNVRTAYLTEGDTYRPIKRRMKRATTKQAAPTPEASAVPAALRCADIFSSRELDRRNARSFIKVSTALFASPKSTVTSRVHEDSAWRVTLSKTRGARCYVDPRGGTKRSYKNLRVDIGKSRSQRR
jgi:cyanophycinase